MFGVFTRRFLCASSGHCGVFEILGDQTHGDFDSIFKLHLYIIC